LQYNAASLRSFKCRGIAELLSPIAGGAIAATLYWFALDSLSPARAAALQTFMAGKLGSTVAVVADPTAIWGMAQECLGTYLKKAGCFGGNLKHSDLTIAPLPIRRGFKGAGFATAATGNPDRLVVTGGVNRKLVTAMRDSCVKSRVIRIML
jgi:hypothetical protein